MRIDSHQHFWKFNPVKDAWISNEMNVLKRDFLPNELNSLLKKNNFQGCIVVQSDQSEDETNFLLQLAEENDFIKGVVGWVDLLDINLHARLEHFSKFKKLKGFRHIIQAEPMDDFILRKDFCKGISQLSSYNFTFDILIFPKHLKYVTKFLKKFPDQKFVIDHLAKPDFKNRDFFEWEKGIREIALNPNVYCKVSGLVTEADWKNWSESDFTYCLDLITELFGNNRLMFGSDWPVSLLSATYKETCRLLENYYSNYPHEFQNQFWGQNAIEFYKL
jgi:L-fuconolactonase